MTPQIYLNPTARDWTWHPQPNNHPSPSPGSPSPATTFHQSLPNYTPTPLRPLPATARALGLGHVLAKDESRRLGLPSFKILGASWAVHRAATSATPPPTRIVACTAGNWGRAVARSAAALGLAAAVFVPGHMPEATRRAIRGEGEGVEVVVVEGGSYDDSLAAARGEVACREGSVLVMDVGFEGYEDVPQWVVEGYGTMLDESDAQVLAHTGGKPATHAVVPVGAGSVAQAVTQHFKAAARPGGATARVVAVEPTTAASLRAALEAGCVVAAPTGDTIMCGLNCGTISTTAWPVLERGVDASVAVSDAEAHEAVKELEGLGVEVGPCGAATLVALRRVVGEKREELGLDQDSVVVLYCTEGPREYEVPR
ncbi:tryptophan synthase beta subunit-like PLP-dependent enzyme [Phialemonium atrogriseum]|uniref:Tryptophan synthase beta subunit-like PLP-dependent enzyme n=1 Tax=Phialemonium atrogriseum TaxID=1093897 RepID=A0AAJ0BU64_9PEZI|nr:tryptophan synthase beta subunit-like PLP-dependent enzyme [Phialemonium atrogriseum]KAK1763117.1 tryptophan synthase beta subunit-like PLP-dependent enzyme [Phialemonium atrogriseum]